MRRAGAGRVSDYGSLVLRVVAPILLAVAAVDPAAAAAQEPLTRVAEPDIKRGATITADDYPDDSLRKDEQGMTTVEYVVDESGAVRPGSCRTTATSRYRRLDERSCEIIEKRFRFKPALLNGKPVPETRSQTIFWRLPGNLPSYQMGDIALRRAHAVGACLLTKDRALAERIVDAPPGSEAQAAATKAFNGVRLGCWSKYDKLTLPPLLLAASIAEHAVEGHFILSQPVKLVAPDAAPPPQNGTDGLAQCVARRDPAGAQALLATTPSGADEAVAVARIVPHLSPCVMAGTTLRLNRISIRSLAALGLYRQADTSP
jgi:protein TonB